MIQSVGIFCGSSKGNKSVYSEESAKYVKLLASDRMKIVFGAGSTGIMGVVAESGLSSGAYVIGVAPCFLHEKEVVHNGLTELHIVEDMFERKNLLMKLSDAFAILPGGIGTLDELFEVFTALQLEIIHKPVGILNVNGYYDGLIQMLKHMVDESFLRKEHYEQLIIEKDPVVFHEKMMKHTPEKIDSWVDELRKNNKF